MCIKKNQTKRNKQKKWSFTIIATHTNSIVLNYFYFYFFTQITLSLQEKNKLIPQFCGHHTWRGCGDIITQIFFPWIIKYGKFWMRHGPAGWAESKSGAACTTFLHSKFQISCFTLSHTVAPSSCMDFFLNLKLILFFFRGLATQLTLQ